jgi:hypothetical protein
MNLGTDSIYELYGITSPHALEEIASELPGEPILRRHVLTLDRVGRVRSAVRYVDTVAVAAAVFID